jgi:hypothetical protein
MMLEDNWCIQVVYIEFLQDLRKEALDVPGYWSILVRHHPWKGIPGLQEFFSPDGDVSKTTAPFFQGN